MNLSGGYLVGIEPAPDQKPDFPPADSKLALFIRYVQCLHQSLGIPDGKNVS